MLTESHLDEIDMPANLRINDQIRRYREDCERMGCARPYHHFAFGQSPFPPPPGVVQALARHAGEHSYLPTAGVSELREAVAEFYRHHFRLEARADRVVVSPGSKEMIAMLLAALEGPVLVPVPSWVSYTPQAHILKKDVVPLRLRAESAFKLTPDTLDEGISGAAGRQSILILNHPHNPTGATYERSELAALAEVCRKRDVVVIADEIYALTAFDTRRFTSMGEVYPEGTVVTGGLSKDRAAGGYRLGVGVFPNGEDRLLQNVLKIAGSTYSCVAAPLQHAAVYAYSLDDDIERYMRDCASINAAVGEETASLLCDVGSETRSPGGAFYVFVDWSEECEAFRSLGLPTSAAVAESVLHLEHTAMLPGNALLLADEEIAFRCSYVDYDGRRALEAWRKCPPSTDAERKAFVRQHCPLVTDGVAHLGRYLDQVRDGRQPEHF